MGLPIQTFSDVDLYLGGELKYAQEMCSFCKKISAKNRLFPGINKFMLRMLIIRAMLVLLFVLFSCSVHAASLQLSQEEQAWLKEHKRIRISGPQAFPPFQYVAKDGTFKGIASDYIYYIAKTVGLEVEVVKDLPWSEILHKIENKDIDVLTCAAVTSERANYLNFTKPHIVFPLIIMSKKDAPFISGIQSLHNKRIAVTHKNSVIEWLQRDKINAIPHYVDSPLEGLKEVSLGNADVAIENLATATYLIEKNGLTNLKIAAPTSYEDYALSIAIRKDWPELISIFDKVLAAITDEKHNEIRQKWISVRYEHGISVKDIIQWVILIGGIAVFLLSFFYYWNKKLVREIQERKRAESENENLIIELRKAFDEIKVLHGILPICSYCKKIRDEKGSWRQIEQYIYDHSGAQFSHGICEECMEKQHLEVERYFKTKKSTGD